MEESIDYTAILRSKEEAEPDSMAQLCVYAMMLLPDWIGSRDIDEMWNAANYIVLNGPQNEQEQRIFAEATALRLEGDAKLKQRMRGDFG